MSAKVILDTIDFRMEKFQTDLEAHNIQAKIVGNANGFDEIEFSGTRKALQNMIFDWFGADEYLYGLIIDG